MAKIHGKSTYISVGGADISTHCNTSAYSRKAATDQTTGYGADDHTYSGGLRDTTFECGGVYDSTAVTGPRAVFNGQVGNPLAIIRRPEGTGSGRPQDAFSAILQEYVETSPVADMVSWAAKLQVSGPVTTTTQP